MGNMGEMLKQAKQMQERMQAAQEELARMQISGDSAAGSVTATVNGRMELVKIAIDKTKINPADTELLEEAHRLGGGGGGKQGGGGGPGGDGEDHRRPAHSAGDVAGTLAMPDPRMPGLTPGPVDNRPSRRKFNLTLALASRRDGGGGGLAAGGCTVSSSLRPTANPKRHWPVGRDRTISRPARSTRISRPRLWRIAGFWIVNLQPAENRLVAISVMCTTWVAFPTGAPMTADSNVHATDRDLKRPAATSPARPRDRWSDSPFAATATAIWWWTVVAFLQQELGQWQERDSYVEI